MASSRERTKDVRESSIDEMREAVRSQLRKALVVWAVASLTWIIGACTGIAISIYGFLQGLKSDGLLISIGPMWLGTALLLVLTVLFDRVRDRFERRCWELIEADPSTSIGGAEDVLAEQAGGRDDRTAAARARQSKRFHKRLAVLIEHAFPRCPS